MDLLNPNPQSAEHCANKPGIIRSNLTEGNFFAARKTLAILDNIVNFVLIAKNSTVQIATKQTKSDQITSIKKCILPDIDVLKNCYHI